MVRSQTARLYRSSQMLLVGALILLQVLPASAQLRTTKPKKGPRAIAVVRWQTNAQGKSVPRLLPVVILEDGKYYDASLYRATPRPMALEPGVVYEAQDQGEVLGYFTVQNASRNVSTRQWYGLGQWQSANRTIEPELRERPQTAEVVKEKDKSTSPIFSAPVDDRDIKKKTTVYDEEGKEIPEGQEPKDDEKATPSLKRKQGDIDRLPQVAPPEKKKEATDAPKNPDDDPERPKLKRGTGATATNARTGSVSDRPMVKSGTTSKDDDPNRPILRRGGGQQKTGTGESDQSAGAPVPARIQARGDVPSASSKTPSGFATRSFEAVAVSDAEDTGDKLGYRFRWTDSEREELTAKMRILARLEAEKFLKGSGRSALAGSATPAGKPSGPSARGQAAASALEFIDRQIAGLDLDANNSVELVYAGSAALDGGKTLFVTMVARTDVDGNPRKLSAVVTASDRLDVAPRLEFVDAVDADGDGRAELLFRRVSEHGAEYVLYRVGPDTLTELFHGGAAE